MIVVIFELEPRAGERQAYLDAAAALRPLLERIDGFVSVERFESLSRPGRLLLAAHHIAVDGWSMTLLVDELKQHYASAQVSFAGTMDKIGPAPTPYSEFVGWHRTLLEGEEGRRLSEYWKARLTGELPNYDVLYDRHQTTVEPSRYAWQAFHVEQGLVERLKIFARTEGTTLYVVCLAALQVLLYRYTDQEDVMIATPSFGRSRSRFARTIGDFVNMLVLRDSLQADRTGRDLLAQTLLGGAADQLDRLRHVEGLGQVFEGAALERADGTVEVAERRHDDDRQARLAALDLGQQLDAAGARHADVAHQHLRRLAGVERIEHVARPGEGVHRQMLARQRALEHEADRFVVVDHPDRFHAARGLSLWESNSGQRDQDVERRASRRAVAGDRAAVPFDDMAGGCQAPAQPPRRRGGGVARGGGPRASEPGNARASITRNGIGGCGTTSPTIISTASMAAGSSNSTRI